MSICLYAICSQRDVCMHIKRLRELNTAIKLQCIPNMRSTVANLPKAFSHTWNVQLSTGVF